MASNEHKEASSLTKSNKRARTGRTSYSTIRSSFFEDAENLRPQGSARSCCDPLGYNENRGQKSYQQNRQGSNVGYKDCGDDSFTCSHCGACFWIGEALKNSTRRINNDPIYTTCCHNGEVHIPLSKPTPMFLDQLLDPSNGPTDSQQYGLPIGDEIAGLNVGDIGKFNSDRDIVIQSYDGRLNRISKLHPKFLSLQYPLFFPYGEDGFRLGLALQSVTRKRERKRNRLTMIKFVCHQLHDRQNDASTLLKGGRLFQQYLVDAYATVEENRIEYARAKQNEVRCEKRKNIYAAVSAGVTMTRDVGNKIILPNSFTGGPRNMINNYQDAMAIYRQYGNPDLFITFTCNVNWPEIKRYLTKKSGYKQEDRPDIVSRIFKIKLDDMLTYIKSGEPFGQVQADVCTVEFQKRGLPHAHILFWLEKPYKCYTAANIDSIISAELPDKQICPDLFSIFSQFMIHGPCGKINPNAPCMQDGKCTKRFPKPYNIETNFEAIKPPIYKRCDSDTKFVVKNKINVGNNYVVPYNSNLLLRYNAHINVESCSQSMLIKYLFKYINKGPDRARVSLHENIDDEIRDYLNCRYLTPHESIWRLFEFSIHSRHPVVQLLQIHLPIEQNVVFKEYDSLQSVLQNPITEMTMFTKWLEKNQECEEAKQLTYVEFPTKFVWDANSKCWIRRRRYETIGRLMHVPPVAGELYYMRMLLNIQKGCRTYSEIRTVNGITYGSYQEACRALGILEDDKEWNDALTECSVTATSYQMCRLFTIIIIFCTVSNPQALFDAHWVNMSDDILYKLRSEFNMPTLIIPEQELKNNLLFELEQLFKMTSTTLSDHQLLMPDPDKVAQLNNRLMREELDYDCDTLNLEHLKLIS